MFKTVFNNVIIRSAVAGLTVMGSGTFASAQDSGVPSMEILKNIYPGKAYSPYAKRSFPNNVYWGEAHVHTGYSLDAGLFGNTTGPDTALRLARGEQVMSSTGQPLKLSRPLDWLVVIWRKVLPQYSSPLLGPVGPSSSHSSHFTQSPMLALHVLQDPPLHVGV